MDYKIYKITNKINGKCYIGQTIKSIEKRFKDHCKKSSNCLYLKHAIQKYGKDNFERSLISIQNSKELANLEEKRCIIEYNTIVPNGYNLTFGGDGGIPSEETRKKMSLSHSGEKHHNFGKHLSNQTKKKISEANKGSNHPMFGKTIPDEIKKKISISNKGRPAHNKGKSPNKETRDKISNSLKGPKNHNYHRDFSKEHRAKISIANKGNTKRLGDFRFTNEQAIEMKRMHDNGISYISIAKMYDTVHSVIINSIKRLKETNGTRSNSK